MNDALHIRYWVKQAHGQVIYALTWEEPRMRKMMLHGAAHALETAIAVRDGTHVQERPTMAPLHA